MVEVAGAGRAQVARILEADGDIVVIGQAATSAEALELIVDVRPDVVTLGLDLPDGGGRATIEQIMFQAPTPILVLSAAADAGTARLVVEALAAGALDSVPKPDVWTADREAQLRRSVRLLNKVHVIRHRQGGQQRSPTAPRSPTPGQGASHHVVAIGASTGGPSVLAIVLAGIGEISAPVLVVQHLHVDFTAGLVEWMGRESALPVQIAEHGEVPLGGHVYIAPGGVHLRLGPGFRLVLDLAPLTIHRPSVDELFRSVAEQAGSAAVGVLLTGMGDDGARGLLAISRAGGRTMAQNESSSAVFGMPAAARKLGAVTEMLAPAELAKAISQATRENRS